MMIYNPISFLAACVDAVYSLFWCFLICFVIFLDCIVVVSVQGFHVTEACQLASEQSFWRVVSLQVAQFVRAHEIFGKNWKVSY